MNTKIIILIFFLLGVTGVIFYLKEKYAFGIPHQNASQVQTIENISYISDNNPKHQLDIYIPKNKTNFPVVHFVHGGYWRSGDKNYYDFATGLYANIGTTLANHGIGVVIQNYRLTPGVTIVEQVEDIQAGIDWTSTNIAQYGGDTTKIYLMGHSAGGHLISLFGTNKNLLENKNIAGFIDMSGILDVNDMIATNNADFNMQISYPAFTTNTKIQTEYSPKTYITDSLPNFLILMGEHDIPYVKAQTEKIIANLANKPLYHVIPGFDHIDMITHFGKSDDQLTAIILNFINQR